MLHRRSARAFLLLLAFLSSGTTLPSLDAIVYHHGSAELEGRSHVEVAGECVDHAGHCELGRTPAGSNAVAGLAGPTHNEPLSQAVQIPAGDRPQADADRHTAARPRAPPSPVI